jgi:predicted transcriptional regulator
LPRLVGLESAPLRYKVAMSENPQVYTAQQPRSLSDDLRDKLREVGLRSVDLRLAAILVETVDPRDDFGPSQLELASRIDRSQDTVQRSLGRLERVGFLKIVARGPNNRNRYQLTPERVQDSAGTSSRICGDSSRNCGPYVTAETSPIVKDLVHNGPQTKTAVAATCWRPLYDDGVEIKSLDQLFEIVKREGVVEISIDPLPFGPPPQNVAQAEGVVWWLLVDVAFAFDSEIFRRCDLPPLIARHGMEKVWIQAHWLRTRVVRSKRKVKNVGAFFKTSVEHDWEPPKGDYMAEPP